ncbi:hypothetical protein ACRAWD_15380 [Caulobacter segnis]
MLAGAVLRLVNGVLVDRIEAPRRSGMIGQLIVLAGLVLAWLIGVHNYHQVLALGVVPQGVAGASFAVALPLGLALVSSARTSRRFGPGHRRRFSATRATATGRPVRPGPGSKAFGWHRSQASRAWPRSCWPVACRRQMATCAAGQGRRARAAGAQESRPGKYMDRAAEVPGTPGG